eukprot:gene30320-34340_t
MPSIPLPFVVALVLLLQLGVILSQSWPDRPRRPIVAFLAAAAFQASVVGARWGLDWQFVRSVQPLTAAIVPVLALWVVDDLTPSGGRTRTHLAAAALATVGMGLIGLIVHEAIDFVLVGLFTSIGLVVLARGLAGGEPFSAARLDDMGRARAASVVLGLLLIGGAVVDTLVGLSAARMLLPPDMAPVVVAVGNLVTLAAASATIVVIAAARPGVSSDRATTAAAEPAATINRAPLASAPTDEADIALLARLETLMRERRLYCDADLSLDRLARRLGVPARALSSAINRHHGVNVSQFVNGYRIAEALELLRVSD